MDEGIALSVLTHTATGERTAVAAVFLPHRAVRLDLLRLASSSAPPASGAAGSELMSVVAAVGALPLGVKPGVQTSLPIAPHLLTPVRFAPSS